MPKSHVTPFVWPSESSNIVADDLLNPPDRMFTSRSEYRMTIRSDNADLRLTGKGERQPGFLLACFPSLSAKSLNDESDAWADDVV